MQFDKGEILGTAELVSTPEGNVWKVVWKGQEMDDYQTLSFPAEIYHPGTILIIKRPQRGSEA